MKRNYFLVVVMLLSWSTYAQNSKLKYTVNLNDIADDQFKVTLDVSGLKAENNVYQFAATAPGTYQVMDIGRFVRSFKAYDKKGNELTVTKDGDNQYLLSDPKQTAKIVYSIAETWDTKVDRDMIYKMCGSSIEKDNVLINGQCVFGYPKGLQSAGIEVKIDYPSAWLVGTSLLKNKQGYYYADSYDRLVDSPIMLGNLTKASTLLGKATIDIYTYSKTGMVKSEQLLGSLKTMLSAADAFIGGLPVDRYTFLYHFEDESWGAWEHSYGSEYILKEEPYTEESGKQITGISAHEFFHVVTPLNIHSEIIEHFNFVTPTASEHLWLYEGTTEWASDMMQVRSGMMDLNGYFGELNQKLTVDQTQYDTTYSLVKISQTSYTTEGQRQYGNIYARGALVAGLLDIRLLELSKGTKGYREVIQELAKKYGPKKSFPETEFFKIFTAMTYPEIAGFFDNYVINANPLPVKEYYSKLGINYQRVVKSGKMVPQVGVAFDFSTGKLQMTHLRKEFADFGFEEGDEPIAVNGKPVDPSNLRQHIGALRQQTIGSEYTIMVKRGGEEKTITGKILAVEDVKRNVFEVNPNATEAETALRNIWLKNLKN